MSKCQNSIEQDLLNFNVLRNDVELEKTRRFGLV